MNVPVFQAKGYLTCGRCPEYPCERVKQAFDKNEVFEERARKTLSQADYEVLNKAFFLKKSA
jgi:hypothetical protein